MSEITEMPSNLSAEKAVLSAMMFSEKLYRQGLAEGIDDECFNFPTNQILFEVLKTQTRDTDGQIDLITLVPHLNDIGLLTKAGGPGAVSDVYSYAPSGSGWTGWVDSLREMKARRLGVLAAKALSEATDSTEAMQTVKDAMEAMNKEFELEWTRDQVLKEDSQEIADLLEYTIVQAIRHLIVTGR